MADMLPQEIAEKVKPREFVDLCSYIEQKYKQKFGVLKVFRGKDHVVLTIELDDKTHHLVRV